MSKAVGSGFPLACYGGRRRIMQMVAPAGGVYQAGTYSGNPVSVTAELATLRTLKRKKGSTYTQLDRKTQLLSSTHQNKVWQLSYFVASLHKLVGIMNQDLSRHPILFLAQSSY